MRWITRSTAAALLGAAAAVLWAPAHAVAGTGAAEPSVAYCGADRATGLAVSADGSVPCATALQVVDAYTKAASGTGDRRATVRVDGTAWTCRERQGDPNPYQECVDAGDSGRRIIVSS